MGCFRARSTLEFKFSNMFSYSFWYIHCLGVLQLDDRNIKNKMFQAISKYMSYEGTQVGHERSSNNLEFHYYIIFIRCWGNLVTSMSTTVSRLYLNVLIVNPTFSFYFTIRYVRKGFNKGEGTRTILIFRLSKFTPLPHADHKQNQTLMSYNDP